MIEIVTSSMCPYCQEFKKKLDEKKNVDNVVYHDIISSSKRAKELLKIADETGEYYELPVVFKDNEYIWHSVSALKYL